MTSTIPQPEPQNLQKNAVAKNADSPIPKEVLNPVKTAEKYTFRLYPPSEQLSPYVDYYWIMRWDMTGEEPFTAEVLPSPYTNLTFMPEGARITGVTTGKYTYTLKDQGVIIGAKFKPGGLYAFCHKNMQELTDTVVEAATIFPSVTPSFYEKILRAPDRRAVMLLEKLLLDMDPVFDQNLKLVSKVLTYIDSTEQPTLPMIVKESGKSERRLHELFQTYVGVGLKHILVRSRLLHAVELAASRPTVKWTRVALDLGYTDQSHFSNDFKRTIGKTPRQYAAELKHQS